MLLAFTEEGEREYSFRKLANEETRSRAEIFKNRRRTKYAAQGSIGGFLILIWALKSDIFYDY
ncbi:MAG: hypothetical protein SVK54_03040 [candidate division WOR-3 bacterium]|nr:hypothetical protein [candidate division WOR-3 bacterium]